jgi:hypothetical protein
MQCDDSHSLAVTADFPSFIYVGSDIYYIKIMTYRHKILSLAARASFLGPAQSRLHDLLLKFTHRRYTGNIF